MEAKLPNPMVMQRLCFSGSQEVDSEKTTQTVSTNKETELDTQNSNKKLDKRNHSRGNRRSTTVESQHHTDSSSTTSSTTTETVFQLNGSVRVHVRDHTKDSSRHRKTKETVLIDKPPVVISTIKDMPQTASDEPSRSLRQTLILHREEDKDGVLYDSVVGSTDSSQLPPLSENCDGVVNSLCTYSYNKAVSSSRRNSITMTLALTVLLLITLQMLNCLH